MTLERCIELYEYGAFRIEEYLVHCSQNVEWRNDFVLGAQTFLWVVFILIVILSTVYVYRRMSN